MFARMARRAVRLTHRTTLCVSDQSCLILVAIIRDGDVALAQVRLGSGIILRRVNDVSTFQNEIAIKVGPRRTSRPSDQLAAGGHAHYLDDAVSAHGDQAVDHVYDNTDMIGDHTDDVSDVRPIIAGR